jgi:hypothetical protein
MWGLCRFAMKAEATVDFSQEDPKKVVKPVLSFPQVCAEARLRTHS